MTRPIPTSVSQFMAKVESLCGDQHPDWALNFKTSFTNTLETTLKTYEDGTSFLLTGDIPAMWLRDSTAQINLTSSSPRKMKKLERLLPVWSNANSATFVSIPMPMPSTKKLTEKDTKQIVPK